MPFQISENFMGAIDTRNGATLKLKHTPEIDRPNAVYVSSEHEIIVSMRIARKFQDVAPADSDQSNPSILVSVESFNLYFYARKMYNFEFNTNIVESIIRMIAFANKRWPLSRSPYLWSQYDDYASGRLTLRPGEKLLFQRELSP